MANIDLDEITESELVSIINKVVEQVAPSFKFGYYDLNDIKQEARLYALESLSGYDKCRGGLEGFLYRCIKFKLLNLHRKHLRRSDAPDCDKDDKRYKNWEKRNKVKKSLSSPVDITNVLLNGKCEDVSESIAKSELINMIEDNLEISLRSDFLRLLDGATVPKQRRKVLFEKIKVIITDYVNV